MIADAVKSRGRSRHGHLAGAAMTMARDEKPLSHIYLQWPTEKREGRLARIRSARDVSRRENTSRWALFPSLFPPSEVSRLWFREPQKRVRRGSEPAAGDLIGGDDAI